MIEVLIVDDHQLMRQGLRQILEDTDDIVAADEAQDGQQAIEKVRARHFDLVLLDVAMPGMDGLAAIHLLRQEQPDLSVLVLTMYPEEQYAVRFLKAGAAGYLTKDSASEELITAIRKIAQGGRYVTMSLAEKLVQYLDVDSSRPAHEVLSDREYQVMRMIASGQTNSEIAAELSLSVKTVSTYRTRILTKLGLRNNAEIMQYAVREGLV